MNTSNGVVPDHPSHRVIRQRPKLQLHFVSPASHPPTPGQGTAAPAPPGRVARVLGHTRGRLSKIRPRVHRRETDATSASRAPAGRRAIGTRGQRDAHRLTFRHNPRGSTLSPDSPPPELSLGGAHRFRDNRTPEPNSSQLPRPDRRSFSGRRQCHRRMAPGRPLAARAPNWNSGGVRFCFETTAADLQAFTKNDEPVAIVLWHNRLFLSAEIVRRYRQGRPAYALVSASKDGAWLSAFFRSRACGRCAAPAVGSAGKPPPPWWRCSAAASISASRPMARADLAMISSPAP